MKKGQMNGLNLSGPFLCAEAYVRDFLHRQSYEYVMMFFKKTNTLWSSTSLLLTLSQVLIGGLADTWPARTTWTTEELLKNYGDTAFKLSQRSRHKIRMKLKDYVAYMKVQHDEDPLYIFDEKVPFQSCCPLCTVLRQ